MLDVAEVQNCVSTTVVMGSRLISGIVSVIIIVSRRSSALINFSIVVMVVVAVVSDRITVIVVSHCPGCRLCEVLVMAHELTSAELDDTAEFDEAWSGDVRGLEEVAMTAESEATDVMLDQEDVDGRIDVVVVTLATVESDSVDIPDDTWSVEDVVTVGEGSILTGVDVADVSSDGASVQESSSHPSPSKQRSSGGGLALGSGDSVEVVMVVNMDTIHAAEMKVVTVIVVSESSEELDSEDEDAVSEFCSLSERSREGRSGKENQLILPGPPPPPPSPPKPPRASSPPRAPQPPRPPRLMPLM